MAEFEYLSEKKMNHVTRRLAEIEFSLNGLSALLRNRETNITFASDEFYGIGLLLNGISREISISVDILRCGFDSTAITENSTDAELTRKAQGKEDQDGD